MSTHTLATASKCYIPTILMIQILWQLGKLFSSNLLCET